MRAPEPQPCGPRCLDHVQDRCDALQQPLIQELSEGEYMFARAPKQPDDDSPPMPIMQGRAADAIASCQLDGARYRSGTQAEGVIRISASPQPALSIRRARTPTGLDAILRCMERLRRPRRLDLRYDLGNDGRQIRPADSQRARCSAGRLAAASIRAVAHQWTWRRPWMFRTRLTMLLAMSAANPHLR